MSIRNEVDIHVELDTTNAKREASSLKDTIQGVEKTNSGITGKAIGAWTAVGNVVGGLVTKAFDAASNSMGKAIAREDTLKNFPKVMESLGYETSVADKSINDIKNHLDGLPSSTQAIASFVQQLTATTGNLEKSTDVGLAFNDMMLAGGASTEKIANAQQMFNSMLASGKADQERWLSLVETAPGQMDQLAKSMLGAEANQNTLREAIQNGTVSFDEMCDAIVNLDKNGGNGIASFEDQARAATGGIGTAMENVNNRIAAAIQKVIDAIGQEAISDAINGFSSKFTKVADIVIAAIDAIKETFDFAAAEHAMQRVAQAFSGSGAEIKDIAAVIGKAIGTVANIFVSLVDAIAPILPIATKLATVLLLVHGPASKLATIIPKVASGIANATLGMSGMVTAGGRADAALGKVFSGASKVAGISAGALTTGIMAAVAAITVIVSAIAEAIEKQQKYEKATTGLVAACSKLGDESGAAAVKIGKVGAEAGETAGKLGESTDALGGYVKSVDELIEDQAKLADEIGKKFADTEADNAALGAYAEKIAELAGNCDGSAEKLSELRTYVDMYNDAAGTSYKITDDFSGALDVSTDRLLENAEAFKQRARAAAAQEVLTELYKEQFEAEKTLTDAMNANQAAWNAYNAAQERAASGTIVTTEEMDALWNEVLRTNAEVEKAQGLYDSTAESIDDMAGKVVDCNKELNTLASDGLKEAIDANYELKEALETAGYKSDEVAEYFAELGFTSEDVASMTGDSAAAIASTWGGSMEDVVAACQAAGIAIPARLQGAMTAAEQVMAVGGSESAASWIRGMTSRQYAIVENAAKLSGMSTAQFVAQAERMGYAGIEGVVSYANGISSGRGSANAAASNVSASARNGFMLDETADGQRASLSYGRGVTSGRDNVYTRAVNVSAWVASAFSRTYYGSGAEAAQSLANGIWSRYEQVYRAAQAVANVVASMWRHSVPKDGPLREGGKGERIWGVHAVENFTAGLYEAIPELQAAAEAMAYTLKGGIAGTFDSAAMLWPANGSMQRSYASYAEPAAEGGVSVSVSIGEFVNKNDNSIDELVDRIDERIRRKVGSWL